MRTKKLQWILITCLLLAPFSVTELASASEQAPMVLNRHLAKLLGTWTSDDGDVTFNANGTLIYKGKKDYCAIAQGTIQISKRHSSVILPYRFVNDNLLITDSGTVATYKRLPATE